MKKKTAIIALLILTSFVVSSAIMPTTQGQKVLANLVFKTNGGGYRPDYGLFIAQYLRDIGIDVEVKVEEWSVFVGDLVATHDYDLGCVALTNGGSTPEARSVYTEDGSLNLFQLTEDMPYGNESEEMQDLGVTLIDLEERQQLYYDWQQLMMDKIVPLLPMFSPRFYTAIYSNTKGYITLEMTDIGSGLNYRRKNWNKLLYMVMDKKVQKIVVAHNDRFVRFGFDWFKDLCYKNGCNIEIVNNEKLSPQEELVQD